MWHQVHGVVPGSCGWNVSAVHWLMGRLQSRHVVLGGGGGRAAVGSFGAGRCGGSHAVQYTQCKF